VRRFHELSPEEYAKLDIAEVNLECAEGLPGSEKLNISSCLVTLDQWSEMVSSATQRHWYRFERNPGQFQNSEPYFRMLILATFLQRDLGVEYRLKSLDGPFDCSDSRMHFIHGIFEGFGGTCTSLPVLYVAIGRRLGYPLKLVSAVEHTFVRWDDEAEGEKLNIEATSTGLNCHSDEYYKTWPKPACRRDMEAGWILKSMSQREELAEFYSLRARCFLDWRNYRNALEFACHANLLLSEENPFHSGLHAVALVLYRESTGLVKYGFNRKNSSGVVREKGFDRPMEPWEKWAVQQAQRELERIASVHAAKKPVTKHQHLDNAFADFAIRPSRRRFAKQYGGRK